MFPVCDFDPGQYGLENDRKHCVIGKTGNQAKLLVYIYQIFHTGDHDLLG